MVNHNCRVSRFHSIQLRSYYQSWNWKSSRVMFQLEPKGQRRWNQGVCNHQTFWVVTVFLLLLWIVICTTKWYLACMKHLAVVVDTLPSINVKGVALNIWRSHPQPTTCSCQWLLFQLQASMQYQSLSLLFLFYFVVLVLGGKHKWKEHNYNL